MKQKIMEIVKDILIVLLICSLLLLAIMVIPRQSIRSVPWLSKVVQPLAPVLGLSEAELTPVAEAVTISESARPVAVSVMNHSGRSTAMWDEERLNAEMDVFSSMLEQALDQAAQFNVVSRSQLYAALSGQSVYLRYGAPQPAAVFASWFDATLPAQLPNLDGCALAVQNSVVMLYLIGEENYAAETGIPAQTLLSVLEAYDPDGSQFVFETELALEPLSLVPAQDSTVAAVTRTNPADSRYAEALATALGFNPYGEGRYMDDQGTVSFNETGSSLTIGADGLVTYTDQNTSFMADSADSTDLARCARRFVEILLDNVSGEGRVYLSHLEQNGGNAVCRFDYYIDGVLVDLPQAPVVITFTDRAITRADVQLHAFVPTGKLIHPLPVMQAAALLSEGSALELIYQIHADGTLSAGWRR